MNSHATEQIVHSVVVSGLIDMGNSLLIGLPRTQIERLQRIQNSNARVITPILQELRPVSCRIVYNLLLFVFKSLNDSAPTYIDDLLKTLQSSSQTPF